MLRKYRTLSIITINRNNAAGLEKTMRSVAAQPYEEFEYVAIDGALADFLFNKSNEFDHEQEFREIALFDSNRINKTSSYKRIAFDVLDMEDLTKTICLTCVLHAKISIVYVIN